MSFFKLPIELRLQIYELLLVANGYRSIHIHYSPPDIHPAILQTCKQIRAEASPIMYGKQMLNFSGHHTSHLVEFLRKIGSLNASCIKSLKLEFPTIIFRYDLPFIEKNSSNLLRSIKKHCTNLESILFDAETTDNPSFMCGTPYIDKGVFELVDSRLREICQEITFLVWDDICSGVIHKLIELNWDVNTSPRDSDYEEDYENDDYEEDYEDSDYGEHEDDDSYGHDQSIYGDHWEGLDPEDWSGFDDDDLQYSRESDVDDWEN